MTREQELKAALREIKDISNMRDENNQRIEEARHIAARALAAQSYKGLENMNLPDTQWIEWYMRENPYCTLEAANRALQSYKEICAKIRAVTDGKDED